MKNSSLLDWNPKSSSFDATPKNNLTIDPKMEHCDDTGGGTTNPKKEDPLDSKIISLIKTSAVGLFNHLTVTVLPQIA
ncbi:unnamed protein product [Parnassius apollo]|uniref:(apollo) hypothetical protein n=1 Tax=Parnassius apollo TaxID=110799 RepID=A0A8S3YID3_PARAO|nr:unnamed protein product [Parnassius apollo]